MKIIKVRFEGLLYGGPAGLTQEVHAKDGFIFNIGPTGTLLYVTREDWKEEMIIPMSKVTSMVRVKEKEVERISSKATRQQSE